MATKPSSAVYVSNLAPSVTAAHLLLVFRKVRVGCIRNLRARYPACVRAHKLTAAIPLNLCALLLRLALRL